MGIEGTFFGEGCWVYAFHDVQLEDELYVVSLCDLSLNIPLLSSSIPDSIQYMTGE